MQKEKLEELGVLCLKKTKVVDLVSVNEKVQKRQKDSSWRSWVIGLETTEKVQARDVSIRH